MGSKQGDTCVFTVVLSWNCAPHCQYLWWPSCSAAQQTRRYHRLLFRLLVIMVASVSISGPYLAGLGIGGLAVALALQPTLTNFLSGTYVISDSVIRKGDYIQLNPCGRNRWRIGWRITKIPPLAGESCHPANTKLSDAVVPISRNQISSMVIRVDGGSQLQFRFGKSGAGNNRSSNWCTKNNPEGVKIHAVC